MRRLLLLIVLFLPLLALSQNPDLSGLAGKSLYACHSAALYAPSTADPLQVGQRLGAWTFRPLQEVKIERAIATPSPNEPGSYWVTAIMKLADGRNVLATAPLSVAEAKLPPARLAAAVLRHFDGFWLNKPAFSAFDGPVRGMDRSDLTCMLGNPEHLNDYGRAGQQWIYDGGRLVINISAATGVVEDVQHFN